MAERRYLSEMTAAQAAASIESALDKVSKDLDQISVLEWDSQPVRDMRNREQELHSALVVLRDMETNQGVFKVASTALESPAAPVRQPLTGQEIINRFDFLEGVVNEHYYLKIVKVAEGIQADALAAARRLLDAATATEMTTTEGA